MRRQFTKWRDAISHEMERYFHLDGRYERLGCNNLYLLPIHFERIKKMIKKKVALFREFKKKGAYARTLIHNVEHAYMDYSYNYYRWNEKYGVLECHRAEKSLVSLNIIYREPFSGGDYEYVGEMRVRYYPLPIPEGYRSCIKLIATYILWQPCSPVDDFIENLYKKYKIKEKYEKGTGNPPFEFLFHLWMGRHEKIAWETGYTTWLKKHLNGDKKIYDYLVKKDDFT